MDEADILYRFAVTAPAGLKWAREFCVDASRKGGVNWGKTCFVYKVGQEYLVTKKTYLAQEIGRSVLAGQWNWLQMQEVASA